MGAYPYIDPQLQRQEDDKHLRWLVTAIYVYAGLTTLYFLLFFGLFGSIFSIAAIAGSSGSGKPEALIPFVIMPVVFGTIALVNLAIVGFEVYGAYCLQQRRNYTLCLVSAILLCLGVPFGTVIGVFLIIVLNRPSVRALFGQPVAHAPYPPAGYWTPPAPSPGPQSAPAPSPAVGDAATPQSGDDSPRESTEQLTDEPLKEQTKTEEDPS